jgi:hypothetical protein
MGSMSSADVTRRALSLGAQDTTTGWYAKTYAETTIKMAILTKGSNLMLLPTGNYAKHELTGFTANTILEGDEVIDANGTYYEVVAAEEVWWLNNFSHYVCGLHKIPMHTDLPAYGTGAAVDDPRKRQKVWLDTHAAGWNPKKNDGATNASFITCWTNPPYPIQKVFVTQTVDLVLSVGRITSKPLVDADHYVYGYDETVSFYSSTIDKTGISGENLMWQGEAELRSIGETYPLGSLRNFETMKPQTQRLGSFTLYSVECQLNYMRDTT